MRAIAESINLQPDTPSSLDVARGRQKFISSAFSLSQIA